uniref:Protein spinster n=1 Tax=Echinococcus granulosus TaxID=6210 RepID=A0A068WC61_ECHGR|nr:protein spinster [Echinococcus granulosus]
MSLSGSDFAASNAHDGVFRNAPFPILRLNSSHLTSVLLLFCVNFLNYMDRFTIAGIPDMIRSYYRIDSKRLGLLQTSFIMSYMFLSPVFGYLGDRWKRKYLLVIGLFIWSMVSLASSFVPSSNFGLFLILRCIVGVGEASYSTLAPTILTDLFTGNSRTSVLGFFYFAVPVGSGLGFVLGSAVAHATSNWAWALRITPPLGLFCLLALVFFHMDPPRGLADGAVHLHATSWWSDLRSLSSNRCFLLLSVGFTGNCFVLGALSWFSVDYIQDAINARCHGNASDYPVALLFGLSTCLAGLLGVVVGTSLAQRLRAYSILVDAYVSGMGLLLSAPFVFAGLVAPIYNFYLCLGFVFAGQFLICLNWPLISDMTMSIVIPTRRATANAFQMLMTHAFGDAISPFIIGIIADAQQTPESVMSRYLGMQRALFINVFICILSGFLLLCASWYLEPAKARVQFIVDASRVEHLDVHEAEMEAERRPLLPGDDYGTLAQPASWLSFAQSNVVVS